MNQSACLPRSARAGAHGYVVKSRAARDLIDALDRLLAGGTFFDNTSSSGAKQTDKPNQDILLRQALSFA
jgi:DNA-binding NarL/FixJ family response regulator